MPPAMAVAAEAHVRFGPVDLPGTGTGTLVSSERKTIMEVTTCSVAVRPRAQWNEKRMLTISGPASRIAEARSMAYRYILASQDTTRQFQNTPSEADEEANSVPFAACPKPGPEAAPIHGHVRR